MSLLRKPQPGTVALDITPENAGWQYVGFTLLKLNAGERYQGSSELRELCMVLVGGKATITAGGETFENIGDRMTPFEDKAPYSVYVPSNTDFIIEATTALEIGITSTVLETPCDFPVRLITPDDVVVMNRGTGSNSRRIHNILMGETKAERLLITEVFTPSGNWSSYPPHKHDTDSLPEESYLEETYYHRLNPSQGFVMQRVYTDDRSLDETHSVNDGECILVPKGYHPVGVPHGYESYYLNTMAGPTRDWKFYNDPDHEWILEQQ